MTKVKTRSKAQVIVPRAPLLTSGFPISAPPLFQALLPPTPRPPHPPISGGSGEWEGGSGEGVYGMAKGGSWEGEGVLDGWMDGWGNVLRWGVEAVCGMYVGDVDDSGIRGEVGVCVGTEEEENGYRDWLHKNKIMIMRT